MRKVIWWVVVIMLFAGIAGFVAYERHSVFAGQAEAAKEFDDLIAEKKADNDRLQAENTGLDMQLIQACREGRRCPDAAEVKGYLDDLVWMEQNISLGTYPKRDLDRDIAWCGRRLKSSR
ncbi:MAG: hypothetical protein ACLGXA_04575 [Acidobacteriota bacterium]